MYTTRIYDIIGIGIGPFNLGLAAILHELPQRSALFIDQQPSFNWHPGLLLPTARMQVPYYADLVTIVQPQSPFTYTCYLQKTRRFLKYANHNNLFPLRIEYNRYCQWVAAQLNNLLFGHRCLSVLYDERSRIYKVETRNTTTNELSVFHAKHLVLGTGTVPYLPDTLKAIDHNTVFHAGQYLFRKEALLTKKNITIIGSGQSAAEIFYDLLPHTDSMTSLAWFTRSNRFHPMDYSPLTTEMTSVDYIEHFYALSAPVRERVLQEQQYLYKGINAHLIAAINDALYIREINGSPNNIHLHANAECLSASVGTDQTLELQFQHSELQQTFTHSTEAIIAATGYRYEVPECVALIKDHIQWTAEGRYAIKRNYSIDFHNSLFVQNADLHTHGFNSADLGMGPYRNAAIVNAILGEEYFTPETDTTFQCFGLPA